MIRTENFRQNEDRRENTGMVILWGILQKGSTSFDSHSRHIYSHIIVKLHELHCCKRMRSEERRYHHVCCKPVYMHLTVEYKIHFKKNKKKWSFWGNQLHILRLANTDLCKLGLSSMFKWVFVRNCSCKNVFLVQGHFHINQTPFRIKGFLRGLDLKSRHKVTRKWSFHTSC